MCVCVCVCVCWALVTCTCPLPATMTTSAQSNTPSDMHLCLAMLLPLSWNDAPPQTGNTTHPLAQPGAVRQQTMDQTTPPRQHSNKAPWVAWSISRDHTTNTTFTSFLGNEHSTQADPLCGLWAGPLAVRDTHTYVHTHAHIHTHSTTPATVDAGSGPPPSPVQEYRRSLLPRTVAVPRASLRPCPVGCR